MGRGEEIPSETQKCVSSLRIKMIFCSTRAEHTQNKKNLKKKGKYSNRTVFH